MTHKKSAATAKPPENTGTTRWGTFWKITGFFAFGLTGFLITPYMQIGNDLKARFIYAFMGITLYLFVLLLIYLEELSGFISKILNAIKNFSLCAWEKINYVKKFFKPFCIFVGLTLLIAAELFLIHKTFEGFNNHATEIRNLPNEFNFSLKSDKLSKIQDIRFNTFLCAIGVLFLPTLPAAFFAKKIKSTLEKHILRTFVLTVIIGGILAFLIPTFLYNYGFIGDTKDLTTALLGVTGGVVALFSLIKSHQKSELEREQLDTQKHKDARDHIRQLYNSYSDRFDKAVTELNNKKDKNAAFAAVYKLSHLADDWLDFKDLTNTEKDFQKLKDKANAEVQTIINVFCKYIRSMPYEYTEEMLEKGDIPKEDAEIRRLIFSEISDRSSIISTAKNDKISIIPGVWSEFNFDFTRAPIFYDLNEIHIEKPNFSDSTFYGKANFSGSTFIQDANFVGAKFTQNVNFCETKFIGNADFRSASFPGFAEFKKVKFREAVNFSGIVFAQSATFRGSRFYGVANFIWTLFKNNPGCNQEADFTTTKFFQGASFYRASFEPNANFENAKFLKNAKFSRVDFSKATMEGGPSFLITNHREDTIEKHFAEFASFSVAPMGDESTKRIADFGHAIFKKKANFKNVTLGSESDSDQIIDFSNIEFKQGADFTSATFNYKTYFDSSIFKKENDSTECASFSSATFRRNADFSSVVFKADVDFRAQIFGQEVDFHLANFSGTTDFSEVIFKGYTGFRYVIFETNPPKFVFTTSSGVSYPAKFVAIPETGEPHDFDVDATQSNNNTFDMGTTKYKGIDYRVPKGTVVFEYPEDWDEAQQEPAKYSSPAK